MYWGHIEDDLYWTLRSTQICGNNRFLYTSLDSSGLGDQEKYQTARLPLEVTETDYSFAYGIKTPSVFYFLVK